ncbi:hypothetical protein M408DRAFT_30924 [Serendipita vermifera MAFF 305830]|uniref:G domain-containing protein n=1 Tax=Serendipita vermifera MAFF 305830 TaxID=933852 RepID=A0A0C2WQ83_SERVB|nr:hypothetical protein M408DRAFT_30924 [Serendipita vermifera MAFF 305830]
MSTSTQERKISISAITINAREHSRPLKLAHIAINGAKRKVDWKHKSERTLEASFEQSIEVSPSDRLEFSLHRSYKLGMLKAQEGVLIDVKKMFEAWPFDTQSREWKHSSDGTEIVFKRSQGASPRVPVASTSQGSPGINSETHGENSGLVPTTDDIIRICPRFRILLVGKVTGVGKSSLINQAFGVDSAKVSESNPGQADINTEIISKDNPRFVLHDSQGFEPGELTNYGRVRNFIQSRNRKPDLKDKLHAIWLCFATPTAGGRVLEIGVENLLKLKEGGDLGKVPIIVVITKYDALVAREDRLLDDSICNELEDEEISRLVNERAQATLKKDCIEPLEKAIGVDVLYKAVSVQEGYKNTLADLIQLTFDNVKNHVAKEASVVTAIAQRVNPNVKVDGSIEVGRSRCWAGLASSANFPGRTLLECLDVIHTDIIAVWDFKDPDLNLRSKEFKALMSNMVTDISTGDIGNPNKALGAGLGVVAAIAGAVATLAGPAAPIVIPIAAGVVVAKWLYDVYQNSQKTLERIMAYIVDLTLVMQHIFVLVQGEDLATSCRVIKLACAAYNDSGLKSKAHTMIAEHVRSINTIKPGARDTTIDKIVEIIGLFQIDSADLSKPQVHSKDFQVSGQNERW